VQLLGQIYIAATGKRQWVGLKSTWDVGMSTTSIIAFIVVLNEKVLLCTRLPLPLWVGSLVLRYWIANTAR